MGHRPGKKINMNTKYKVMIGNFNVEFTFASSVHQQVALNIIRDLLVSAANKVTSGVGASGLSDGEVVTKLLQSDFYNRAQLMNSGYSYSNPQYTNILKLFRDGYTYKLAVWGSEGTMALYNGALTYFSAQNHVPAKPTWEQWKDKNVRFTYMGGSTSGEKRLVKVSAYEDGSLKGIDLAKGEFRQFKVDKIKDIVEVKL